MKLEVRHISRESLLSRSKNAVFNFLARDVALSIPQLGLGWLILLAWLAVSAFLLIRNWGLLPLSLHDPDSAMRLVEVRNWLSGQGWFDLHMTRVNPPIGLDSHWSRLVDAGLGGLFLLFHFVTDAKTAELLMRATWPVLWLLPVFTAVSLIAWKLAGREAAIVSLVFASCCVPGFVHFTPGNIDHHNVQIALALVALAASLWSDKKLWAASTAGAVTGLAVAVGLESVPLLGIAGAILAARFVLRPEGAKAFIGYCSILALTTGLSFIVSVSPQHWGHTACDEIAINIAAPIVIGALSAFLGAVVFAQKGRLARGIVIMAGATLASIAFVGIEPRCLGGPYAMVSALAKSEWLSTVLEAQPVSVLFEHNPLTILTVGSFSALALIAVVLMTARAEFRRSVDFIGVATALLIADGMTLWTFRVFPYSTWLSVPLMAAAIVTLFRAYGITNVVRRAILVIVTSPMVVYFLTYLIVTNLGAAHFQPIIRPSMKVCFKTASYAGLAKVPKGTILADPDFGPYLLALTPDSVVAAPYNRLSRAIVADYKAFSLPPAQAHAAVEATGADYVLTCAGDAGVELRTKHDQASLFEQLKLGSLPDWLESVPLQKGPFSLFRVKR